MCLSPANYRCVIGLGASPPDALVTDLACRGKEPASCQASPSPSCGSLSSCSGCSCSFRCWSASATTCAAPATWRWRRECSTAAAARGCCAGAGPPPATTATRTGGRLTTTLDEHDFDERRRRHRAAQDRRARRRRRRRRESDYLDVDVVDPDSGALPVGSVGRPVRTHARPRPARRREDEVASPDADEEVGDVVEGIVAEDVVRQYDDSTAAIRTVAEADFEAEDLDTWTSSRTSTRARASRTRTPSPTAPTTTTSTSTTRRAWRRLSTRSRDWPTRCRRPGATATSRRPPRPSAPASTGSASACCW